MCVMCYLSTDREIADVPFDENDRKFNLQKIENRPHCFAKRNVYYCGSHQSCGCGFGNMGITEEVLRQTEQDFARGALEESTEWMWWNQSQPPPKDQIEFEEQSLEIKASHRDTVDLYRLIKETISSGFSCEVLVCWAGNENDPPEISQDISLKNQNIEFDFDTVGRMEKNVLFYRITK